MEYSEMNREELKREFMRINQRYTSYAAGKHLDEYFHTTEFQEIRKQMKAILDEIQKRKGY